MRIPTPTLLDGVEPEVYEAGAVVFEAGQTGEVMYIVQEGQVEIRAGDRVLETVEPGGIFGEMALIENAPRSASAVTTTGCRLLLVSQKQFLFMVDETPFFAIEVMRSMSARLRRTET